jgi:hypothetical protein
VYCIPLPDSAGQFAEVAVTQDYTFVSGALPPGAYRLIAFKHRHNELEYRNPEAMQVYDQQGIVVRLAGGQKEHVRLQFSTVE